MRSSTAAMCSMALIASLGLAAAAGPSTSWAQTAAEASGAGSAEQPSQVIQSVAERFLQDLDAHRAAYQQDPKLLRAAVDRDVLPYFDVQFAARLVLARYWRTATPQQQQRFISAFESSMFANYGSALLGFQSNRLKVEPTRVAPGTSEAQVRTLIHRDDGSDVQVNFQLHETPQGWKAWDVIVEGVSYVKSFRDDFGSEIEQQGLEAVIQRLERGEAPQVAAPGAGKS